MGSPRPFNKIGTLFFQDSYNTKFVCLEVKICLLNSNLL